MFYQCSHLFSYLHFHRYYIIWLNFDFKNFDYILLGCAKKRVAGEKHKLTSTQLMCTAVIAHVNV